MKIKMETVLVGFDGDPVLKTDKKDSDEVTLRFVVCHALQTGHEADVHLDGEEKMRRFLLAQKCYKESVVDMKAEDVTLIKKLLARTYSPALLGPAFVAIGDDPKAKD